MTIRRFEDIESWQLGREVSRQVYVLMRETGLGKDFSLKDQMLRSSGSIMDNIAEGFDSGSNKEFIRFLQYAKRSCSELQSQLYRAADQEYIAAKAFSAFFKQIETTKRKIGSFIQYLSKNLEQRTVAQTFESTPNSRTTTNREPRTGN